MEGRECIWCKGEADLVSETEDKKIYRCQYCGRYFEVKN